MNIKEIAPDILYVGVNDRTTTRFEGLWPLPIGVSYNSYLVKDSRTALIDTVEAADALGLIENIRNSAGVEKIDYLVVNHMEPDHSGSIPLLATAFPEMKIIGNRQTISMIKGFYHISDDSRFIEVKDNDVIELGEKTLRFFLTPMVHWPETMMTFVEERSVLFTGDAFGTFGALAGGVVDYEMDTEPYISEMYRYYSNIVGKYGRFVQNALARLSGIKADFICPTHGPVWHDEIARVGKIVSDLSLYTPEEGVTIVYGSMYGNTAHVAEMIASALAERGVRKIKIHNASFSEMSYMINDAFRYKGLIVGGPTYSMTLFPPVAQFMEAMATREIKNKVFATFGSHAWAPVNGKRLAEYAEAMKLDVTAHVEVKQSADEATREAVAKLADEFVARL